MFNKTRLAQLSGSTLFLLLTVTMLLVSALFIKKFGMIEYWNLWNISIMLPEFLDMANLSGAHDSIVLGYDPLYRNVADPAGRPLNNPRIVQHIVSMIGIGRGDNVTLAYSAIALFFIGVVLLSRRINKLAAIVMFMVLFSPAVMLGIERANNDLVVFFLVNIAVYTSRHAVIAIPFLLFAAFIKLFPIFGAIFTFRFDLRKSIILFFITLSVFICYLAFNWADLQQIFNSTQKGGSLSYGVNVIMTNIDPEHRSRSVVYAYAPVLALMLMAVFSFMTSRYNTNEIELDSSKLDAFRVGAAIYVGTFLLGNIWDYRLMFLLFTIPQLAEWVSQRKLTIIAIPCIICVLVSCWATYFAHTNRLVFLIDECANYTLFALLAYLLLLSLPKWMLDLFPRNRIDKVT